MKSNLNILLEQPGNGWTLIGPDNTENKKRALAFKNSGKETTSKDGNLYWRNKQNVVTPPPNPSTQESSTGFKNADEGNAFRKWFRTKYPSKANELKLDETGGFDNAFIRKAYNFKPDASGKIAGEIYKSETGGGTTAKPTQQSQTIQDIDKDVASATTFFRFYTRNTNDEQIFWLNPIQNTSFETDSRIMSIVSRASRIKKMEGVNAAFAYLKAVIFETGDLVGSFDILAGKVGELSSYMTTRLDENTTFHRLIGLANLLFEQSNKYVRYFIKRSDGGKYIGGQRGSNKRGNLDVTWVVSQFFNNDTTYFSPLKFSSSNGLPDEAPIVGEVKIKLGLNDRSNIFTSELETKIKEKRKSDNIIYNDADGDIDFPLIKAIFKDRFDEVQKRLESSRSDVQQTGNSETK